LLKGILWHFSPYFSVVWAVRSWGCGEQVTEIHFCSFAVFLWKVLCVRA
jgi:hypothetical protein